MFPLILQHAEVPPNVYEMVACVDWAVVASGPKKSFEWSTQTEEWFKAAKLTLQKNSKAWADKQLKAGDVEGAVLSYQAALRYVGEGSAGYTATDSNLHDLNPSHVSSLQPCGYTNSAMWCSFRPCNSNRNRKKLTQALEKANAKLR